MLLDIKFYLVTSFGLSSHQCNGGYQDVVCFCWHQNWHRAFHWNSQTQFQSSFKGSACEYCAVHLIDTGELLHQSSFYVWQQIWKWFHYFGNVIGSTSATTNLTEITTFVKSYGLLLWDKKNWYFQLKKTDIKIQQIKPIKFLSLKNTCSCSIQHTNTSFTKFGNNCMFS